jgi:hypothetical protein
MDCTDSLRRGVLIAVGFLVACQTIPSGSDEFGDAAGDDDDGGSTTFGNGDDSDDDDDDDADESTEDDGGTDDGTPTLDCDPVAQTGCAAGEKCTVTESVGQLTYACVADDQSLDPYAQCTPALGTGIDGCIAGNVCFADEMDNGLCVPLCLDTSDCQMGLCIAPPTTVATYCADQCSPFETSCPAPMQCRRAMDRFVCEFGRNADTGGQGDPCSITNDDGCAEGFVCLPGELVPNCTEGACCTNLCDTGSPGGCDSPAICASIFESPAPGNETYGACFVPA